MKYYFYYYNIKKPKTTKNKNPPLKVDFAKLFFVLFWFLFFFLLGIVSFGHMNILIKLII